MTIPQQDEIQPRRSEQCGSMKITNMSLAGWVLSVFCLLLGVAFSIFTIHVALAAVTLADIGGCILLGAFSFLTLAAAVGLFKVGLGE